MICLLNKSKLVAGRIAVGETAHDLSFLFVLNRQINSLSLNGKGMDQAHMNQT